MSTTLPTHAPATPTPGRGSGSYRVETWGCQMNVLDADKMSGALERHGYVRTDVPIDADVAPWTIGALEAPSIVRVRVPKSTAKQGIRDISYDQQTGDFLILIGRSKSTGDEPFQLCAWNGSSDNVELLDVTFHRSMKPEGVVAFSSGEERKLLIVDDRGGYAVIDYPARDQ